jgi:O-antigen biosynthesis protein WbqP
MMQRLLDLLLASIGLLLTSPLLLLVCALGWFDTGSPIFRQTRVGRHQRPFTLIKFRTMRLATASVPTHLAKAADVTSWGSLLRRTKLDELPQLWNVIKGDMSLVGPRPCLFDQHFLRQQREQRGVFEVRPGITGLAQVRGIDMSTPELLAHTDAQMIAHFNLAMYFRLIVATASGAGQGDRILDRRPPGDHD